MAQDEKVLQTIPEHDTTVSTERVQPSMAPEAVTVSTKRPRRKLPWILATAIVLVATAGAVFAYAVINRPENILADSFNKLLTAKSSVYDGNLALTLKQQDGVNYHAAFSAQNNQDMSALTTQIGGGGLPAGTSINGALVTTKSGDIYFKLDNLRQLVSGLAGDKSDSAAMVELFLSPVASVLDGKWVKITADDLKSIPDQTASDACSAAAGKLSISDSDKQQIDKLFRQHMPANIQVLGDQSISGINSSHFRLTENMTEAKKFVDAVKKLSSFKQIAQCIDQNKQAQANNSAMAMPTVDVWINKSSHDPTKLEVQYEDATSAVDLKTNVQLNGSVKSQVPSTNIIPLKDLQNTLLQSFGASLDSTNAQLRA